MFGDQTVLKVFRKLEPGHQPRARAAAVPHRARLCEHRAAAGLLRLRGTLVQPPRSASRSASSPTPSAAGSWRSIRSRLDPADLLNELGASGRVTAQLHNALASDNGDPAFSPEEPSSESLSLLTATIDEDIERIFVRLPEDERVAPIAGRGQDVRERIAARSQIGLGGRAIRTHGDFHLGQTLHTAAPDWVIIDFEGEPARPLFERRQKRSPLRDVASMLRSFAYVSSASEIMRGRPGAGAVRGARPRHVPRALPRDGRPGAAARRRGAIINLLSIFELEKAIYELQYELDNRPEWLPIPVAGIVRLLESE